MRGRGARDIGGAWFTSHVNENLAEVAEVRRLFGVADHYVDTYDRARPARRALRARPQRARRPTSSCDVLGRAARRGRPLPDEQLRARQRAVPAAPARRPRRPGGARLRRRCRHRLLAVQGGAAGVLHAAAARPRRGAADLGPPAPPGDRRRAPARWAWPTGSATSRSARSSTRSGCDRSAATELDVGLRHTASAEEALGKIFALASDADVAGVWVGGQQIASGGFVRGVTPGG